MSRGKLEKMDENTTEMLEIIDNIKDKITDNEYKTLIEKLQNKHNQKDELDGYYAMITKQYYTIKQTCEADDDDEFYEKADNLNAFSLNIVKETYNFGKVFFKNLCDDCKNEKCQYCLLNDKKVLLNIIADGFDELDNKFNKELNSLLFNQQNEPDKIDIFYFNENETLKRTVFKHRPLKANFSFVKL